ncbi:inhibin beta B chain [Denticeps clupeoides]|uniref:TGF-beta family profile domain-containing protein n=1 Tax=Denticeps clupeoides TaxID=299321 RepID=A0AAY4AXT4_9TELE|nr:inhibin beta B chain-like [Denticeps clupeoides]
MLSLILSTSTAACLVLGALTLEGLAAASTAGCASCALESGSEEKLLVEIAKQQILSKLHLKERPNITHTVPRAALMTALRKLHAGRVRPDGTLELENNLSKAHGRDQAYELVSFADMDGSSTEASLSFQFVQEQRQSVQVLQSSLWLYVDPSTDPERNPRTNAYIYLSGLGGANRTLLLQKTLDVQKGNWHTFPVTQTLQAFMEGGQRHLRLEVWCGDDGQNLCGSFDAAHQPFLVAQVYLRDDGSKHSLTKRSLRCGDDVTVCCKKDFYIKFRDIQWQDWIIAPEGYHMNYCMGQCPQHLAGSPGIASSFHATVFSQLKANGIHTAVSSCCVPIQRRPLSMVYFNSQHSIVKADVPDMIVESCGCT